MQYRLPRKNRVCDKTFNWRLAGGSIDRGLVKSGKPTYDLRLSPIFCTYYSHNKRLRIAHVLFGIFSCLVFM